MRLGHLFRLVGGLMLVAALAPLAASAQDRGPRLFLINGARNVNPDTHFVLTFPSPPAIGNSGKITVYDASDNSIVDVINMSRPPSPNPTGRSPAANGSATSPPPPAPAGPNDNTYQSTQIGGAWFHFFPVMVRGNSAIITLHHGRLEYGHQYVLRVDGEVVRRPGAAFTLAFATKPAPPAASRTRLVVSADGRGDFSTVQGAIDFAPARPARPLTIFIRNGDYPEIAYMRGKSNLTLRGQDREKTVVHYPNNSAFNRTRPAFTVTDSSDIQLSTFTIKNDFIGQAEALLLRGQRNIVDRMTLNGSGDAFTTYGSIYMVDSKLTGDGDTILAYAALYCLRCRIESVGPFTWTRTPQGSHGNVFVDSTFVYIDKPLPWSITPARPQGQKSTGVFARLPRNGAPGTPGANFLYAEMVLINARTQGVPPEGWGPIQGPPDFNFSNVRFMEVGTRDMDGRSIDLSKRHPIVRVLVPEWDTQLIANYSNPEWVLGGWKPVVRK